MRTFGPLSVSTLLLVTIFAGCIGGDDVVPPPDTDTKTTAIPALLPIETGECVQGTGGPPPPLEEEVVGLQPIELIFGGSIRSPFTRVLLVPPSHGDLGSPTNMSRSGLEYLGATLEGIFAWEPAIDVFIQEYPQFAYLDNVSVQVELFEGEVPETAGYDIIVGYAETSGPLFRGVAFGGADTQQFIDAAGLGDVVHFSGRFILLSLFAYSERAGQSAPDFPETHEIRGVTMHEFAHTWGVGHSTTWTPGCGADLMNSPYPFIYGDGNAVGDGGERTKPLCITSLDLLGLAQVYRWLPNGTFEGSAGSIELPDTMQYKEYCTEGLAAARAQAFLAENLTPELRVKLHA